MDENVRPGYARGMARRIAFVLALVVAGAVVAVQNQTTAEPLQTVAQITSGLRRHTTAWIGRTVRVRGAVVAVAVINGSFRGGADCGGEAGPCLLDLSAPAGWRVFAGYPVHALLLAQPVPPTAMPPAFLAWQRGRYPTALVLRVPDTNNPLAQLFQHVPLLRSLISTHDLIVRGDYIGTYRITILDPSTAACAGVMCRDDAVLLGTAP